MINSEQRKQNRRKFIETLIQNDNDECIDEIFEAIKGMGFAFPLDTKIVKRKEFGKYSSEIECYCEDDMVFISYVRDGTHYQCLGCGKDFYFM